MEMIPVQVEADVSDGMPQFTMVGYVSAQVKEAQDRVRTALKNMGISLPPKRITINLSPADVRKEGSRFDLPIAAGVLMTLGRIPPRSLRKTMVLGELGLDGHVQEISGVFPAAAKARELGCTTLLVPAGNAAEGGLVGGLHVVGIQNLQELLNYCCEGKMPSLPSIENQKKEDGKEPDFSEVQGQTAARRAALIAAAGFHNLLMLGPPGSGKSMIARRIPTIMPPMSEEEQMEVTRIYSIAGMLAKGEGVRRERPFRAPHHTMSPQALAGGGKQPSPGEITLAHRGVLFLDELPEMTRTTIEIFIDSITRLARAYNLTVPPSGRTLSGGLDPAALYMPKRFFGAARNMREGGSLTILATALVDTGSKMDDVVYEEFKGTGNMELVLDRKLQERRVFPAIDIAKSGTRREDLLLTPDEQEAVYNMRKALNGMKSEEAVENILNMFDRTRNNGELIQILKKQKIV